MFVGFLLLACFVVCKLRCVALLFVLIVDGCGGCGCDTGVSGCLILLCLFWFVLRCCGCLTWWFSWCLY